MKLSLRLAALVVTTALALGFAGASAQTNNGISPLLTPNGQTVGGVTVTPNGTGATIVITIYQATPNATYNVCVSQPALGVNPGVCAGGVGSGGIATDGHGNGSATFTSPVPVTTIIVVATNAANPGDTAQATVNTNFPTSTYCLLGC